MPDPRARLILDAVDRTAAVLERADSRLAGIEKRAKLATRAIGLVVASFGVREITRALDQYTALENRLKIVTDSAAQLTGVQNELRGIAAATRAPFEGIVELYQRASIGADELGASQEQLFRLVEITGKALAIQGGSASESSGALRQLSQSFQSGIVRAEEFNSILEGAFPLAQAAARGFDAAGGSVGRLRQLVIEGEVSSKDFFEAIIAGGGDLDDQFRQTRSTIGQAASRMGDSLVQLVGHIDEATGASGFLAGAINAVSDAIDRLTLTSQEDVLARFSELSRLIEEQTAEVEQRTGLSARAAQERLRELQDEYDSLIATLDPTLLRSQLDALEAQVSEARQLAVTGLDPDQVEGLRRIQKATEDLERAGGHQAALIEAGLARLRDQYAELLQIVDPEAIEATLELPGLEAQVEQLRSALGLLPDVFEITGDDLAAVRASIRTQLEIARGAYEEGRLDLETFYERSAEIAAEGQARLDAIARDRRSAQQSAFFSTFDDELAAIDEARRQQQALEKDLEGLRVSLLTPEDEERETIRSRLELAREGYDAGLIDLETFYARSVEIAAQGQARLNELAAANPAARRREELERELEAVRIALLTPEEAERESIRRRLEVARESYEENLIDLERFYELSAEIAAAGQARLTEIQEEEERQRAKNRQQALIGAVQETVQGFANLATTAAHGSKRLFEIGKALSLANAIVNTHEAVTAVLADKSLPTLARFALAAVAAAKGAAEIAAIQSTSFGGGASSRAGAGGGAGAAGAVPPPPVRDVEPPERSAARAGARVEVNVYGNVIGEGGRQALGEYMTTLLREHTELTDDVLISDRSANAQIIRRQSGA